MGNDIRYEIVQMFMKYKRLCPADIAEELSVSKPVVYNHLNNLFDQRILVSANPEIVLTRGHRAYYTANPEYFGYIASAIMKDSQALMNVAKKGAEEYNRPRYKKRKTSEEELDEDLE